MILELACIAPTKRISKNIAYMLKQMQLNATTDFYVIISPFLTAISRDIMSQKEGIVIAFKSAEPGKRFRKLVS